MLVFFARHVLGRDSGGAALNYMPVSVHRKGFEGVREYMAEVWENPPKMGHQATEKTALICDDDLAARVWHKTFGDNK